MLRLLSSYGFPPALALPNRFGAIIEPLYDAALTPSSALARGWYGRDEVEPVRSKSWVRTSGMREDINIGNHDVFEFVERGENPRTGTIFLSGFGYETSHLRLATMADPRFASMLHVLNIKEHSSKLPFDRDEEVKRMVENEQLLPAAVLTLQRAKAVCQACANRSLPGCAYDC